MQSNHRERRELEEGERERHTHSSQKSLGTPTSSYANRISRYNSTRSQAPPGAEQKLSLSGGESAATATKAAATAVAAAAYSEGERVREREREREKETGRKEGGIIIPGQCVPADSTKRKSA